MFYNWCHEMIGKFVIYAELVLFELCCSVLGWLLVATGVWLNWLAKC